MSRYWWIPALVAVLAAIIALASSCSFLPRELIVRALVATQTPTVAREAGQPEMHLSPAEGRAGTRITVTGRGWQPGDIVYVRLENPADDQADIRDQASAMVDEHGEVTIKFTFPLDPYWTSLPRVRVVLWSAETGARAVAEFRLVSGPQALPPTSTSQPVATRPTATSTPGPLSPTPSLTPTATSTATATPTPTSSPLPSATPTPVITDWRGEYWPNPGLEGAPSLVRNDLAVDFDWGANAPAPNLPADGFSVRWTRALEFAPAAYRFVLVTDDGARLWVDDSLLIDEWRDGSARQVSAEYALARGRHDLRIEYYERTGQARVHLWWEVVPTPSYPDWHGEYWPNRFLAGEPSLVRNDAVIDFRWGSLSPAVGLPADGFSARWRRQLSFQPGIYRLFAQADDGIRVYIGDQLVLNHWQDSSGDQVLSVDLVLSGSQVVTVEYYENTGAALARFWWQWLGPLPTATPVPTAPATATPTSTAAPTATPTPTATWTTSPTATATSPPTPTATPTGTATPTTTYTPSPTLTAVPTATATPTTTATSLPTFTATSTPTPMDTCTCTPVPTQAEEGPGETLTPTATPEQEATVSPELPATPAATPTAFSTMAGLTTTPTPGLRPRPGATRPLVRLGVRLSEVLPVPAEIDWDGDGSANADDQWIELHNNSPVTLSLAGWVVGNSAGGGTLYRMPRGTTLRAGAYLVLYRGQAGIALDPAGDTVYLLDPRGRLMDSVTLPALAPDTSYSRDRMGHWHSDWPPSPGAANQPPVPTVGPPLRK
jgi:hypothetical protein